MESAMNKLVQIFAIACACSLVVGCLNLNDEGVNREKTAIEKILSEISKAMVDFPKTKDAHSFLKFLTDDYSGIENGKSLTRNDIEKNFSTLLERINLGEPIGISHQLKDVKINLVSSNTAWVTYEDEFKVGSGGKLLQLEQSKCTCIFRKRDESWLIQHEHCSGLQIPRWLLR
jgi:ketosteroid isomerase-like protein